MKDFFEDLLPLVIAIIIIGGLLVTFLFGVIVPIDKKQCITAYEQYNPQYTIFSGCRIEYNGKITPVKNIRMNEIKE